MSGKRILDRFTGVGRRLTDDERRAVDAMHAKYPNVELRPKPASRYRSQVANLKKC